MDQGSSTLALVSAAGSPSWAVGGCPQRLAPRRGGAVPSGWLSAGQWGAAPGSAVGSSAAASSLPTRCQYYAPWAVTRVTAGWESLALLTETEPQSGEPSGSHRWYQTAACGLPRGTTLPLRGPPESRSCRMKLFWHREGDRGVAVSPPSP